MTTYSGGCHCGDLALVFETERPAAELGFRFCGCGFCRRHGALYISDPGGRAVIEAREASAITRYRFGHRTADFLFCARCGVYLGAACRIGERDLAVVNANALDPAPPISAPPATMDYDAETGETRLERRARRWTPLDARAWSLA